MNNRGYTLTEAMVSLTLLTIIVLGALQYSSMNRWDAEAEIRTQLAWGNMAKRMALAVDFDYNAILDSLPETSVPLLLKGIQGYRSTIVSLVDDPLDGVAPMDKTLPDYLKVTVTFAWFTPDNVTDSLSCYISEERGWHY